MLDNIIKVLIEKSSIDKDLIIEENFELSVFGNNDTFIFKPTNDTIMSRNFSGHHNSFFTSIPLDGLDKISVNGCLYVFNYFEDYNSHVCIDVIGKIILLNFKDNNLLVTTVFSANNCLEPYPINQDELYVLSELWKCNVLNISDFFYNVPLILGPQRNFNFDELKKQVEIYDMYRY